MKSVVKSLSIITAIAFVVGIIVTAIYLYKLPDQLVAHSSLLDLTSLQEIQPPLFLGSLIISVVLGLGLAALVLQVMLATASSKENIVYVEKFISDNSSTNQNSEHDSTDGQSDTSSFSQEILDKIKQASAETKEPEKSLEFALRTLCTQLEASQGAVFVSKEDKKRRLIELRASFAYMKPESETVRYEYGEGLPGQVAKEGIPSNIKGVPDGYIKILSGLGQATPKYLLLIPVKEKDKVIGVVEMASFTPFTTQHQELTTKAFAMLSKQFSKSSENINVLEETLEHSEEDNSPVIKTARN